VILGSQKQGGRREESENKMERARENESMLGRGGRVGDGKRRGEEGKRRRE